MARISTGFPILNIIMTALHWKRACFFIVSGVVKIERDELQLIEINYGSGDCDAKAVVTRGGESKEILLRHKRRIMMLSVLSGLLFQVCGLHSRLLFQAHLCQQMAFRTSHQAL
jgi:hypothetical protein